MPITRQDGATAPSEKEAEQERYLRKILQTYVDGFWVIDATGRFIDVNEAYCAMSGYSREEFLGLGISDIDAMEDAAATASRIEAVIQKGSDIFETKYRRKDGSVFDVEVSVSHWGTGGVMFVCFCRDITERKRSELALRERLKEMRCLYGLSSLLESRELSLEELPGRAAALVPPAMLYPELASARVILDGVEGRAGDEAGTGPSLSSPLVINGRAAGSVTVSYSGEPPALDEGPFLKEEKDLIGEMAERISRHAEKVRAEQVLARSMREHEALLAASRAVLEQREFMETARAIFDIGKDITGATAGYVALLSESGDENEVLFLEAGGRPCAVDPELPMPIRGLRAEAYRLGKAVYDNDFHHSPWMEFMPPGHVRLDNVMFAPLVIGGATVGIMGLANRPGGFTEEDSAIATALGDIAAIALINSRNLESLKVSIAERDILMRELQHRVKNNMNLISSLLGLEMGGLDDKHSRDVFENMQNRIRSMSGLYEQLYGSGRLGSISVKEYMVSVVESLSASVSGGTAGARLTLSVDDISLDMRQAVPLGLIVNELVTNSLKHAYTPDAQGEIRVELRRVNGNIELAVSDDGGGFPADMDIGKAKSMGMKIVSVLVQQLEGTLSLEGGPGARVRIVFPA